jgi:hypothetical protein
MQRLVCLAIEHLESGEIPIHEPREVTSGTIPECSRVFLGFRTVIPAHRSICAVSRRLNVRLRSEVLQITYFENDALPCCLVGKLPHNS